MDVNSSSIVPGDTSTCQPPALHHMLTGSKTNSLKPKHLDDDFIRYPIPKALVATTRPPLLEPTCYSEASKYPEWRQAMNEEFDALIRNPWTLVPPKPGVNLIGCKWVYRIKRHADGRIERFKAHLVAKGYNQ